METFSQVATNIAWTTNAAFGTGSGWSYPSAPAAYFWAGFGFFFTAGLFALGVGWVKRLIGGGHE